MGTIIIKLITWTVAVVLAIAVVKVALGVLSAAVGLALFLLFTVVPIIVIGWLTLKIVRAFGKKDEFGSA